MYKIYLTHITYSAWQRNSHRPMIVTVFFLLSVRYPLGMTGFLGNTDKHTISTNTLLNDDRWQDVSMYSMCGCVSYPRLGILSAMPVIPAIMLLWEIMTPFGTPVEPLVYMITATSDAHGGRLCLDTVDRSRRKLNKLHYIKY